MVIKVKKPAENLANYDHQSCSCGQHFGVGIWDAERRAEVYAWFRDKYKPGFDSQRQAWLASYQRQHGAVQSI